MDHPKALGWMLARFSRLRPRSNEATVTAYLVVAALVIFVVLAFSAHLHMMGTP